MVPYVQSLLANFVSAYYLTTALQHGRHKKKKISFFLFPLPLGQICFVLVLISPNHKARHRYPEMVMARTEKSKTCIYLSMNKKYKIMVDLTGSIGIRNCVKKKITILLPTSERPLHESLFKTTKRNMIHN